MNQPQKISPGQVWLSDNDTHNNTIHEGYIGHIKILKLTFLIN